MISARVLNDRQGAPKRTLLSSHAPLRSGNLEAAAPRYPGEELPARCLSPLGLPTWSDSAFTPSGNVGSIVRLLVIDTRGIHNPRGGTSHPRPIHRRQSSNGEWLVAGRALRGRGRRSLPRRPEPRAWSVLDSHRPLCILEALATLEDRREQITVTRHAIPNGFDGEVVRPDCAHLVPGDRR